MCLDSNYNLFRTYDNFYIPIDIVCFVCFKLHVVLLSLHLQSHEICSNIALGSFLLVIILNGLTFMSFVSVGTHIFGEKALKITVHLFKLIMNK